MKRRLASPRDGDVRANVCADDVEDAGGEQDGESGDATDKPCVGSGLFEAGWQALFVEIGEVDEVLGAPEDSERSGLQLDSTGQEGP